MMPTAMILKPELWNAVSGRSLDHGLRYHRVYIVETKFLYAWNGEMNLAASIRGLKATMEAIR